MQISPGYLNLDEAEAWGWGQGQGDTHFAMYTILYLLYLVLCAYAVFSKMKQMFQKKLLSCIQKG